MGISKALLLLSFSAATAAAATPISTRPSHQHLLSTLRPSFGSDKVIHLSHDHASFLNHKEHNVDVLNHRDNHQEVRVSQSTIEQLKKHNIPFEDRTEEFLSQRERFLQQQPFCEEEATVCAAADNFYDIYQPLDSILAKIDLIISEAPAGLVSEGSLGQTYEGRNMPVFFLGQDASKETVFYTCGIHAREWLTPVYCVYMMENLLLTDEGRELLDLVNFVIVPSQNPDGYSYTFVGENLWRKSRKPNEGSDCIGTDLNRNFDDHWAFEGASPDPCSETYHGTAPFDNIETDNLQKFAFAYKESNGTIINMIDVHSYGPFILSPYGWSYDFPPTASLMSKCMVLARDAVLAVGGQQYEIGTTARLLYLASGGNDDWFNSALDVPITYTVEVRGGFTVDDDSFQPPPGNIRLSNTEVWEITKAITKCSYENVVAVPTAAPITAVPTGGAETLAPTITCEDLSSEDNKLTYENGNPAECVDLKSLCFVTAEVRQRCPFTCGQCTRGYVNQADGDLETVVVNLEGAQGNGGEGNGSADVGDHMDVIIVALVVLAVGILAGVVVGAVVLSKSRPSREELDKGKVGHYQA